MTWKEFLGFRPRTQTVIHEYHNLDKKRPNESAVSVAAKIYERPVARVRRDIGNWRLALMAAELPQNPNRQLLLENYLDAILDSHLTAQIQSRKMKTLSKPYRLVSAAGEEDKEKTALLQKQWFRDFMDLALDAQFWGFTLIQFGDIVNDGFTSVEAVNRFYVRPEFGIVVQFPTDTEGVSWDEEPFADWCVFVGGKKDLGLLNKAAPLCIWKKNAIGAWAEYQEIFGMPFRIGRTNISDELLLKNMSEMMANMGRAAWGVFNIDDEIEFVSAGGSKGSTGGSAVYLDMIKFCDEQLSKLILGQTMTADDGSSRAQAEVHENVANDYAGADQTFVEELVNEKLLPKLARLGLIPPGFRFEFDNTENRSALEQWDIDSGLLPYYNIPADYITSKYGVPVEDKPAPVIPEPQTEPIGAAAKDVQARIKAAYKATSKYYDR